MMMNAVDENGGFVRWLRSFIRRLWGRILQCCRSCNSNGSNHFIVRYPRDLDDQLWVGHLIEHEEILFQPLEAGGDNPVILAIQNLPVVSSSPPGGTSTTSVVDPRSVADPRSSVSPGSSLVSPGSSLISPRSSLISPRSSLVSPRSSLVSPRSSVASSRSSMVSPNPSSVTPRSSLVSPRSSVLSPGSAVVSSDPAAAEESDQAGPSGLQPPKRSALTSDEGGSSDAEDFYTYNSVML